MIDLTWLFVVFFKFNFNQLISEFGNDLELIFDYINLIICFKKSSLRWFYCWFKQTDYNQFTNTVELNMEMTKNWIKFTTFDFFQWKTGSFRMDMNQLTNTIELNTFQSSSSRLIPTIVSLEFGNCTFITQWNTTKKKCNKFNGNLNIVTIREWITVISTA